jgi:uncharacterized protein (TIGR03546 family)
MLSYVVRPLRRAVQAMLAGDSPSQLAAGFALGMILGLMPKGNLIALSLCVLLFSLRVNAPLGVVAVAMFSWISTLTDPISAHFGREVLAIDALQPTYASIYNMPLGPWWGFHNTAVVGSLIIGMYLVVPVFWAGRVAGRWAVEKASSDAAIVAAPSAAEPRSPQGKAA